MSGFIAIVDPERGATREEDVEPMISALGGRGERAQVWRTGDALLAVVRFDWELRDGFAGTTLVVNDGDVSVAADATLYYRQELSRRLRAAGVRPTGDSVGHLIAAAYRAWGVDCAMHLEGDFAFVVYDASRRRLVAARDFMGRRPIYYAEVGGALLVASSIAAIVAHPECPRAYDELALGEIVAVSLAGAARTPYTSVCSLPPATLLVADGVGSLRTREYWKLDVEENAALESFDDAAEHLHELLGAAMVQRVAPDDPTTIWLSGGYDSPVMYAVANAALDSRGGARLAPVSFSHPIGDAGREDELIDEITAHWNTRPRWLSIDDVPLLAHAAEHAARMDVPFQHAFENWLRALLRATRDQDSRVALYGDGGDQLFAVSTVFLRDLFTDLRWRELRREWRAFGGHGVRSLWHAVVRPAMVAATRALRSEPAPHASLPSWIDRDFAGRHDLEGRHAAVESSFAANGWATAETRRSLCNPVTPRVLAGMSQLALEHGVEMRAPLLDRRLVEFALGRPRSERASAGAVKHLLRHAARDLLPPSILAPRKAKTGVLTDYFGHSFRADPGGIVSDAFARSRLAGLGIVDGAAMQQAWREYKAGGGGKGGHLFVAFQTEMWLRARDATPVVRAGNMSQWSSVPAAGFVQ